MEDLWKTLKISVIVRFEALTVVLLKVMPCVVGCVYAVILKDCSIFTTWETQA
jgi:hypothetical protein